MPNLRGTFDQWAEAAETLDWPTADAFAETVWRMGSKDLPLDDARRLYRECGYIPFSGFPLSRAGRIPTMTRAAHRCAWDTNPILIALREAVEA